MFLFSALCVGYTCVLTGGFSHHIADHIADHHAASSPSPLSLASVTYSLSSIKSEQPEHELQHEAHPHDLPEDDCCEARLGQSHGQPHGLFMPALLRSPGRGGHAPGSPTTGTPTDTPTAHSLYETSLIASKEVTTR